MDFCSECGSMILNGSKCPMCGCIKTAETKEVKKTPQPEKKIKTNKKPVIETFTKDIKTEPEKIASKNGKYLKKDYKSIDDLDDKTRQELLANDEFFKTVKQQTFRHTAKNSLCFRFQKCSNHCRSRNRKNIYFNCKNKISDS